MIYLDSSALVKLAHAEPHSDTLAEWLAARVARRFTVSSALARVETIRALRRSDPQALPQVSEVLSRVFLLPVDDRILEAAGALLDPLVRTLDAIHLATVQVLGAPRITVVSYDKRLLAAVSEQGFNAAAPGT